MATAFLENWANIGSGLPDWSGDKTGLVTVALSGGRTGVSRDAHNGLPPMFRAMSGAWAVKVKVKQDTQTDGGTQAPKRGRMGSCELQVDAFSSQSHQLTFGTGFRDVGTDPFNPDYKATADRVQGAVGLYTYPSTAPDYIGFPAGEFEYRFGYDPDTELVHEKVIDPNGITLWEGTASGGAPSGHAYLYIWFNHFEDGSATTYLGPVEGFTEMTTAQIAEFIANGSLTPEPTPTEESTMSQLDAIVSVTIDRQTQSVSQQSFGIPGVIGQFLTSKTTTAFTRAREYADTAEMLADGWTTADAVYKACAAIFRQNPTVPKVIVGRKDAADADWAAALTAINNENGDWYRFVIVPVVTATPNDEYLDAAEWTETQKKRLFIQTLETDTLNAALSTDLAAQLKALGYERTVVQYHLAANTDEYAHTSWVGEGSPFDPGSSTWAYKTLKGVTADKLTTGQKSAAWGKNCNTYTTVGGVSITEKGVVASGEFIDILDGIDWIESRLQETVFGSLVNLRKIPYDDSGIQMIRGLVKSVLDEAGRKGILQGDTIEVTAPKYKDIPSADRMARHLPDIKFTALLQGAIHTVAISGVVSV